MEQFISEFSARIPALQDKLLDHLLYLTVIPVFAAICTAIPMAIWARNRRVFQAFALGTTGIMQTIPSLAMLAFLLPLLGIGKPPAIVALTLYALLPIFQNTLTGLRELPSDVLEAADGLGFSPRQRLRMVDLPLAAPVMMSGIRTATTICVGIATLSTFIGAGGLGDFVNRGLALNRIPLILLGAGAAAALALLLDYIMATVGLLIRPGRRSPTIRRRSVVSGLVAIFLITVMVIPTGPGLSAGKDGGHDVVRIGSKNFTEQFILGELMAQGIERRTDLRVERIFNLGGTVICDEALKKGEIDLYAEYTGTSLIVLFGLVPGKSSNDRTVYKRVKALYESEYGCTTTGPFGFNNTYRLTVTGDNARNRGWIRVSDLREEAPNLVAGFTSEFIERADGMKGLLEAYGLQFKETRDMSPELMYAAVADGDVDVICAFSTDGRIAAFGLATLEDDRHYFPPYEAVPVVRTEFLRDHPEVGQALEDLAGRIDDEAMRRLNNKVDVEGLSPREVAEAFLHENVR